MKNRIGGCPVWRDEFHGPSRLEDFLARVEAAPEPGTETPSDRRELPSAQRMCPLEVALCNPLNSSGLSRHLFPPFTRITMIFRGKGPLKGEGPILAGGSN